MFATLAQSLPRPYVLLISSYAEAAIDQSDLGSLDITCKSVCITLSPMFCYLFGNQSLHYTTFGPFVSGNF